jgi:hypothetical protein
MLDVKPTMVGCPSCAGCLRVENGPHGHRRFVCSVGHAFSLWDLYEAKETELERAQWSTMALLMHLQMLLEMLLDTRELSDMPDSSRLRQRFGQVQQHIAAVQRMIDTTSLPARESTTALQSESGGDVR